MATLLQFYEMEPVKGSSFVKRDTSYSEKFAVEDLARSRLKIEDIYGSCQDVPMPAYALAGYIIPYFGVDGKLLLKPGTRRLAMWRARYKVPPLSKDQRYLQPSAEDLKIYGLPSYLPYLLPYPDAYNAGTIYCVEGEKKTASVIKNLGVAAFGIAGCQMWRNPTGDGGVHPWILEYCRAHGAKRVRIIPDSDVHRYDMAQTYGVFSNLLRSAGFEVELLCPRGKIDDLIAAEAGGLSEGYLDSIPRIGPESLVESPASLAIQYNLAFERTEKRITVHQNIHNIMKLMEEHPGFTQRKIWKNLDTCKPMIGEEPCIPSLTEVEIACFFQYNLGFHKVTVNDIKKCMAALARKNEKSPMLEWVKSQTWDGVPRLETWLSRLWGVEDNEYTRQIGRKWLEAACARMDAPGTKIDWIFITIGAQAAGKTSMPGIFFDQNYKILYGEQNDKDFHMLLHSGLCVGFDELDSFGKKESSALKAMITRQTDAFRPPYEPSIEEFPRRFTLYGSGNRREFLQHDPSGYRRYAIVEVRQKLDFDGLKLERDQLWAEAWHLYSHERNNWWEIDGASEAAENFVIPNTLEERILGVIEAQFTSKHSDQGPLEFTMTQLQMWLGIDDAKNSALNRDIAGILHGINATQTVTKRGGKSVRLWKLKRQ